MAKILLGVTGSIAAYKAADLASKLKQRNHHVTTIMTESATKLVAPSTFLNLTGNRVHVDLWDEAGQTEHIKLTDEAEVMIVAPATANVLAKIALGLADDMLSTTLLAVRCAVVVCPAMNTRMWSHPVVRRNLSLVRSLGHRVVEPGSGNLACGHVGEGRLAEVEDIMRVMDLALASGPLRPIMRQFIERQVLVREPDPKTLLEERAYRARLAEGGILLGSGPVGPGEREAMHLLRAATLDEARTLAEQSPLAKAQVISADVIEWRLERGELAPPSVELPRVATPGTAELPTAHFRVDMDTRTRLVEELGRIVPAAPADEKK